LRRNFACKLRACLLNAKATPDLALISEEMQCQS